MATKVAAALFGPLPGNHRISPQEAHLLLKARQVALLPAGCHLAQGPRDPGSARGDKLVQAGGWSPACAQRNNHAAHLPASSVFPLRTATP